MAELAETVATLRAEPLWAASSGARELFHSDMIQWLAEHEPKVFASLFSLNPAASYRCHRERGHLDLWIEAVGAGQPLVVENKLFALPREDQLDGYDAKLATKATMAGAARRLLSLTRPPWHGGSYRGWAWMSYAELGQALIDSTSDRSDFAGQFAAHWGRLCLLLHLFAEAVSLCDDAEAYDLDQPRRDLLDDRLLAFAETLRAYQLADRIRSELGDDRVAVKPEFTRSKAIVEAFSAAGPGFELGWQLQEGQWRMAARSLKDATYEGRPCFGRSAEASAQRDAWAQANFPGHFSFTEVTAAGIQMSQANNRATFQHFAPDFSYQYRKVSGATVGRLVAAGVAVSRRILLGTS